MPTRTLQSALTLALEHHQAGRLAEAEALYRQVLAEQPEQPDALHLLGLITYQRGRPDLAVEWIQRAILHRPNSAAYHYNLANALRDQRQLDAAIAAYQRAIELQPEHMEAHSNLCLAFKAQGRLDDAIAAGRRAVELKPDSVEALNNLAGVLQARGQLPEAADTYRKALEIQPNFAAAHFNLGNLLREQGKYDEAIACYRRAVELTPDHAQAHQNLGMAFEESGRLEEAIAAYRRALELEPNYVEAHNNLGIAFTLRGQTDEAIAAFARAIALQPDYAEAHNNLGVALKERGRLDEAIAAHRRAVQLKPDLAGAHNNLGVALKDRGDLDGAARAFRQALAVDPRQAAVHSNLIFALYYQPGQNRETIAEEQQRWRSRLEAPLRHSILPHTKERDPERRLKIGYVSAGFRDDAIGANLRPLLRCHDHRDFEVLCYSGVVRPDHLTAEFRRHADQWRSTVGVGDEALAAMIREDSVDILVDLTQHIAGTRLPVFARKPAPVQVSFLGYPDAAGLETIEYRISDRWLESEMEDRSSKFERNLDPELPSPISHPRTSERVFLLDSFWCYDPQESDLAVNELPARTSGQVTFGSLNNFCKFNEPVWQLWARVLRAVRNSRLAISSELGSHRQHALEILQREGADPERVEFFSRRPRRAYLELYHRLDIALDPFPYNGHTTSLEALWMGVPVVSLAGETPVARGGRSILNNVGLPELVAATDAEYLRIATELAHDLPRLAKLRATLRSRMESSVLMDAPRFARQIEAAYRAMWRHWCLGHRD